MELRTFTEWLAWADKLYKDHQKIKAIIKRQLPKIDPESKDGAGMVMETRPFSIEDDLLLKDFTISERLSKLIKANIECYNTIYDL